MPKDKKERELLRTERKAMRVERARTRMANRNERIRTRKAHFNLNDTLIDALDTWLVKNRGIHIETIQDFDTYVKAFGSPLDEGVTVPDDVQKKLLDFVHKISYNGAEQNFNEFMDYLYYLNPIRFRSNGNTFTELAREVLPGTLKHKNVDTYARMENWFEHKGAFDNMSSKMSRVINGKGKTKESDPNAFLKLLIQANRLDGYVKSHKEALNTFDRFRDILYVNKSDEESQLNPELISKLDRMGINTKEIISAFYNEDVSMLNENGTLYSDESIYPATNLDDKSAHKVVEAADRVTSAVMVKFAMDKLGAYKKNLVSTIGPDGKPTQSVVVEGNSTPLVYEDLPDSEKIFLANLMCRNGEDVETTFNNIARRAQIVRKLIWRHIDDPLIRFKPNLQYEDKFVPSDMYVKESLEYEVYLDNLRNTILNTSIKYGAFAKPYDKDYGDAEFEFALARSLTDPEVTSLFSQAALTGFVKDESGNRMLYKSKYPDSVIKDKDGNETEVTAGAIERYTVAGMVNLNGVLYEVTNLPAKRAGNSKLAVNDQFELCISDEEFAEVIKDLSAKNKVSFGDISREDIMLGRNTLALDLAEHATMTLNGMQTKEETQTAEGAEEEHTEEQTNENNPYAFVDYVGFQNSEKYNAIREQAFKEVKDMATILDGLRALMEVQAEIEAKNKERSPEETVEARNIVDHFSDDYVDEVGQWHFGFDQKEEDAVVEEEHSDVFDAEEEKLIEQADGVKEEEIDPQGSLFDETTEETQAYDWEKDPDNLIWKGGELPVDALEDSMDDLQAEQQKWEADRKAEKERIDKMLENMYVDKYGNIEYRSEENTVEKEDDNYGLGEINLDDYGGPIVNQDHEEAEMAQFDFHGDPRAEKSYVEKNSVEKNVVVQKTVIIKHTETTVKPANPEQVFALDNMADTELIRKATKNGSYRYYFRNIVTGKKVSINKDAATYLIDKQALGEREDELGL